MVRHDADNSDAKPTSAMSEHVMRDAMRHINDGTDVGGM